jgi:hypothetical protein
MVLKKNNEKSKKNGIHQRCIVFFDSRFTIHDSFIRRTYSIRLIEISSRNREHKQENIITKKQNKKEQKHTTTIIRKQGITRKQYILYIRSFISFPSPHFLDHQSQSQSQQQQRKHHHHHRIYIHTYIHTYIQGSSQKY